jgi:hypothetical protein
MLLWLLFIMSCIVHGATAQMTKLRTDSTQIDSHDKRGINLGWQRRNAQHIVSRQGGSHVIKRRHCRRVLFMVNRGVDQYCFGRVLIDNYLGLGISGGFLSTRVSDSKGHRNIKLAIKLNIYATRGDRQDPFFIIGKLI